MLSGPIKYGMQKNRIDMNNVTMESYGKRQGTLKSNSEWRGEWRMARRTANGERRSEQ